MPYLTSRQKIVLASLSLCPDASLSPVQAQKLFFLIDEKIARLLGGRQFDFRPYDYGPFDKSVYSEFESLERQGYVTITPFGPIGGKRRYGLSSIGMELGTKLQADLPSEAATFIQETASWIRSMSFAQLVGAIYSAYPHMRSNSVFKKE